MEKESCRSRILDCALQLFSSRGFDGVGISEICSAATITKPTLYYYFSSKSGLYESLWLENYAPLAERLERAAVYIPQPNNYSQDVLPVLVNIINVYMDFALRKPLFFTMVAALVFAPKDSQATALTKKYRESQLDTLRDLFASISKAHGNLVGKESLLSVSFLGMIYSFITIDTNTTHHAEVIAKQFMHGIFS
jgi:AcrR family transcriptional regulator